MNRRNFFAFLPIAPAALMIDGARADVQKEQPRDGEHSITLQGSKPPRKQDPNSTSIYYHYCENDTSRRVSMSVGEDGNLWLKTVKGQWKKVVTE